MAIEPERSADNSRKGFDVCSNVEEIPFRDALAVWVQIALNSFGGPTGQIAVMHKYLVEENKWISESRFLHALNYCMLLPGPEAQQLATYIGWILHRTRGGIVAGTLFILPGFLSILALSVLYAGFRDVEIVKHLFWGIKPAIVGVVLNLAVWFALNTIFGTVTQEQLFRVRLLVPVWSSLSIPSLTIGAFAMVLLFRFELGMISCIVLCASLGIVYHLALACLG